MKQLPGHMQTWIYTRTQPVEGKYSYYIMWINHGHNDIWKCLAFSIKLDNSNSANPANVWEVCDEFIS